MNIGPLLVETPVEWDRYLLTEDDYARVVTPEALIDRTHKVIMGVGEYEGMTLPWAHLSNRVRLRHGKTSIWAGITHHGKALSLSTPLPTPTGWTTMGAIRLGDELFDEDGEICRVTACTDVMLDHPCFEIEFSDGEKIIADAEHLWETWDSQARQSEYNARRKAHERGHVIARSNQSYKRTWPSIRTTAEIYETLIVSSGHAVGEFNHSIPLAGVLNIPSKSLPIDPYLLGLWLGDGSTDGAQFHTADVELVEDFEAGGYGVTKYASKYSYGITNGFLRALRDAGVLGNKHVPAEYLRGSIEQRLALLQGLMDTDGSVTSYGRCEYTTILRPLAESVRELALSFGIDARLISGVAKLDSREICPKYRVTFTTRIPVFRLERKLSRINPEPSPRLGHRWIVGCRPVDSVPVKCIQVDSVTSMYLCGRSMVPTHNTQILKQVCLHAVKCGEKVCIASLEEVPEETFADMARMCLGNLAQDRDWLDVAAGWCTGKLWLYDQQGMVSADRMLALMAYVAQEKGVTHFVIDSLMRLGLSSEDYEGQRVFLNRFTAYAKKLNVHAHLVCHITKLGDEEKVPNLMHIKGSGSIADQIDNIFTVWRDKREERAPIDPAGLLVVDKQRGRPNWLGKMKLWYDAETGQFLSGYADKPMRFLPGDHFSVPTSYATAS